MKIQDKTTDVAKILEIAKANGITDSKLEKARAASFLPAKGRFVDWAIDGEKETLMPNGSKVDTRHIRVICATGESISLSSLQASGFKGEPSLTDDSKDVAWSEKMQGYYLRSNCTPNKDLLGNQAAIVAKLIGKDFEATEEKVVTSVYKKDGYKDVKDIVLQPKTLYKVTLK